MKCYRRSHIWETAIAVIASRRFFSRNLACHSLVRNVPVSLVPDRILCFHKGPFNLAISLYTDDAPHGFVHTIFFTDIDECNNTSGGHKCAHICVNTEGSFACACRTRYKLENDGLTCKKGNVQEYDNHCLWSKKKAVIMAKNGKDKQRV